VMGQGFPRKELLPQKTWLWRKLKRRTDPGVWRLGHTVVAGKYPDVQFGLLWIVVDHIWRNPAESQLRNKCMAMIVKSIASNGAESVNVGKRCRKKLVRTTGFLQGGSALKFRITRTHLCSLVISRRSTTTSTTTGRSSTPRRRAHVLASYTRLRLRVSRTSLSLISQRNALRWQRQNLGTQPTDSSYDLVRIK
jgi:hypothetical protein